jgi:uncharacterized protein YbcI
VQRAVALNDRDPGGHQAGPFHAEIAGGIRDLPCHGEIWFFHRVPSPAVASTAFHSQPNEKADVARPHSGARPHGGLFKKPPLVRCAKPSHRPRIGAHLFEIEGRMKTQGEIEAAICAGITDFEREYMGRGPKHIQSHLLDDLLVVRLRGVLTAAERHLVNTLSPEKGRVRTQLIEAARTVLEAMVFSVTDVKVVSLHHDISTVTGEELVLFTLAESPIVREPRRK